MSESRNHSIDFLKFLLAYEVVMLHCNQAPVFISRPIVDSAVPCFFMISGFFMYDVDEVRYELRLKKAISKIFVILCWSTILCGIDDIYRLCFHHEIGNFTWKALWEFLCFNENPFAFHLWYIAAYLYVLVFYWLMHKIGVRVKLVWVIVLWLLGNGVAVLYSQIYGKSIEYLYIRNFLFEGIPFFGIGLLLSQKVRWVKKTPLCGVVLTLATIIIMAIIVKSHEQYNNSTFIFSGIIAFITLVLFLKIQINEPNYLTKIGKEDGLYIYIFHPFVMNLLKSKYALSLLGYNAYLFSTIVFVLTILGIRLYRKTTERFCFIPKLS